MFFELLNRDWIYSWTLFVLSSTGLNKLRINLPCWKTKNRNLYRICNGFTGYNDNSIGFNAVMVSVGLSW